MTTPRSIADNPWAAASVWVGAVFSGGLVPLVFLIITWKDKGSLTRRHAVAATVLWAVLMAIYIPTFIFGMFIPAWSGEPPRTWAVVTAVAFAVISWSTTIGGLVLVLISARRSTSVDEFDREPTLR